MNGPLGAVRSDAAFAAIPAGSFEMGAEDGPHPEDGEGPPREVTLSSYLIRRTTVTNADFAAFVAATGHVTVAEELGGSLVFRGQLADPDVHPVANGVTPWWCWVARACWRYPTGGRAAHPDLPAVHLSLTDTQAFCDWAGTRLPTEAEWERAAQGSDQQDIHIWRGRFPDAPDGLVGPVRAASGAANPAGLHHCCGNVWEWTADRFTHLHAPRPVRDPAGPLNGPDRVVKGGSFLCCSSYCARFRPTSRRGESPTTTTSHLGFRDVLVEVR